MKKFKFDEEVLYMNKSISRIIGVIMLIVAFVFIMFALDVYKRQELMLRVREDLVRELCCCSHRRQGKYGYLFRLKFNDLMVSFES